MKNVAIALPLAALLLSGCLVKRKGEPCLPQGERAVVVRKGVDGGQRFVTLRRANGDEVTCLGDNTPQLLSEGDEVDGWTLTKADATRRN